MILIYFKFKIIINTPFPNLDLQCTNATSHKQSIFISYLFTASGVCRRLDRLMFAFLWSRQQFSLSLTLTSRFPSKHIYTTKCPGNNQHTWAIHSAHFNSNFIDDEEAVTVTNNCFFHLLCLLQLLIFQRYLTQIVFM